jgi:hypothetical protein
MKDYIRAEEERNNPHEMKRRKANWIGHILLGYCLLNTLLRDRQGEG